MTNRHNPFRYHEPLSCYPTSDDIDAATRLEVGPGRGDFLFELARNHPEEVIAAIEIKKKRYYKLIKRVQRFQLSNIRLILGDARVALPCLFRPNQLQSIYILFSDPWPKKRHAKHRLFQAAFVHDLYRTLRDEGELVLAHDDQRYLRESCELLLEHAGFKDVGALREAPLLFNTFYAEKWREEGRPLAANYFKKQALGKLPGFMAAYQSRYWQNWRWRHRIAINSESNS